MLASREREIRSLTRLHDPDLFLMDTIDKEPFRASASLEIGSIVVELDLSGTIDIGAEKARLAKDLDAAGSEVEQAESRLANEEFRSKAPEVVVKKITNRLAEAKLDVERITAALDRLTQSR